MKKNAPSFIAFVFLIVIVGMLEFITLRKTNGVFCYPLDDTFIHMAVAKNQALHGTWGVSSNEWVSTSSSPMFTGLLTGMYKAFGLSVYFPFILGVAGALLIIVAMQQELNRYQFLDVKSRLICLIATLFLGAIPSLAALGMEHTFQIAFTLLFIQGIASVIMDTSKQLKLVWITAFWGACMVFTRYENAFVVVAGCGLLFLHRRIAASIIIGIISALPIFLFGLYAVSHGGLFIPNSIQIKVRGTYKQLLNGGLAMLEATSSISGLIVLAIVVSASKIQAGTI